MYKQVLNSINDVDIFPIISLVVFMVFFVLMIVKVMYTKKEFADKMAALPLDDDEYFSTSNENEQL